MSNVDSRNTSPPTEPVRVLLANDHLGYGGALHGVGRYLLNITTRFDRARVNALPVIFHSEPILSRRFEDRGVSIRCLGRGKNDPRALTDLIRIVRDEGIEVIHVQGLKADTVGRLAGMVTGVPVIIHGRDHIADRPWLIGVADRFLGPKTRHALAVSRTVADYLHEDRHVPPENIQVFYHGVDLSFFAGDHADGRASMREKFAIEDGRRVLGTTIRLHRSKGHVYLLRAIAALRDEAPDLRVLIANEGPEEETLRKEIGALGLEGTVTLTGSLDDVRAFLSALDYFVMPSLSEGFPNAMLEAMAMSRPVVATDVDGMGEMLAHGEDALLVPPADADAMADALRRLLGDDELAARLRAASHRFVEKLSIDSTVERLTELYTKIARPSGGPPAEARN
jgi:glycosyltransferase involved in cell wall biosynthesis